LVLHGSPSGLIPAADLVSLGGTAAFAVQRQYKNMKTKILLVAVTLLMTFGLASQCGAQLLVSRSFNQLFAGDDPSERFDFPLPYDPQAPIDVRFIGYFENFDFHPEETGARSSLGWFVAGTIWDAQALTDGDMGLRLPGADPILGTTRVPFQFEQRISFTPSEIQFSVEGLGPGDRFQFVGEFSIRAVPEPTVITLLGAVGLSQLLCGRRMKRRNRAA
jgi:hypothetical protein